MSELTPELKKIKKIYGERFMKYCREYFPTILEREGELLNILEKSFSRNCRLSEDINTDELKEELKAYTILTAFIPMLMDTGGNAGSQSSVSVIRALSLNDIEFKDIFKVMWKESRVALLCSITLALCNFIKLIVIDRTPILVATTVCTTLIFTIILAKLIGCTLPLIAKKLKFDPAVMASPFITTIVDACSLLIYFYVAKLLLGI